MFQEYRNGHKKYLHLQSYYYEKLTIIWSHHCDLDEIEEGRVYYMPPMFAVE